MSDITITGIKCQCCGAPLTIPKNSMGRVKCASCDTENIIQGLVRNAEITEKENISSGLNFELRYATIHRILLNILESDPYMPLDVFAEATILKVDRIAVPAYYFYCNGIMNYGFEQGFVRERQRVTRDKTVATEFYTEWLPQQSAVSESRGIFTPANQQFADVIVKMYSDLSINDLVDVELLNYPIDTETYENNFPAAQSFNSYAKPVMEEAMDGKARLSLQGKEVRNYNPTGCTVFKDGEVRVFLTFYSIELEYRNQRYTIYLTNDGRKYLAEQLPVDVDRRDKVLAKQKERNAVKDGTGVLTFAMIASIVLTAIFFFECFSNPILILLELSFIPGIVFSAIFRSKKKKRAQARKEAIQKDIDLMLGAIKLRANAFRAEKIAMKGVLRKLSGNEEAF